MNKKTAIAPTKSRQFRHGDVFLEMVEELGETTPRQVPDGEKGRAILAYGEVTGHSHEIAEPALVTQLEIQRALAALGDLPAVEGMRDAGLIVETMTNLVHQEHTAISLPPGKYLVRIQREYTPQEIRRVAD